MGVLNSGGLTSGDTLKGLGERLTQRRLDEMVLHLGFGDPRGKVQWPA